MIVGGILVPPGHNCGQDIASYYFTGGLPQYVRWNLVETESVVYIIS